MRDIMVDLETLGTRPGAVILSIGAVTFDPQARVVGADRFHKIISVASSLTAGLRVETATVKWWRDQSPEAQTTLWAALAQGYDLAEVLDAFDAWVRYATVGEVRLWGNGATFDNTLLDRAYFVLGRDRPWGAYGDRCFRTLKDGCNHLQPVREGVHHNALDDAVHQARWACAIFDARRQINVAAA